MNHAARMGHPDSRWFSQAALGICFDWGLESAGDAVTNGVAPAATPDQPAALAQRFDPDHYDPEAWLRPAVQAGFRYALFTARDRYGYALWPSEHGELGVRTSLGGRDLLQPFIEAGRKMGVRVGLRYVLNKDDAADSKHLAIFQGQAEELLTRYGKIDLLLVEGDTPPGDLDALRQFQPGLVIGATSGGGGGAGGESDFQFVQPGQPIERPEGWWVGATALDLNGDASESNLGATRRLLSALVEARARGGHLLVRCTPPPNGQLPETYAQQLTALRLWLGHSGEAIFGTRAGPWPDQSDVPVTLRGDTWYLHFLSPSTDSAQIDAVGRPGKTRLLRNGDAIAFTYLDGVLTVTIPRAKRTSLVDVVAATGMTLSRRE